ncbi:hypothetical protein DFJ73DRAFT_837803 [Zopfochytrium polystomum]|nr:hypothetical protein DFJ73DRAFT_837803 [Zopfochytrium polystomum]
MLQLSPHSSFLKKYSFCRSHPRLMAYRGITHRFAAAHNNAVESFPLIAAAVLLSQQSGVPVSIRAQFAAYAFVARVLHYLFYLTNLSIPRSVAWFSYSVPCYLLLIASAIPGFSKAYLQAGGR